MTYGDTSTNYSINACLGIGTDAARTAMGWAKEPCPSKQLVSMPLAYYVNGERSRGALVGAAAGITAVAGLYFASKLFND